MITLVPVQAEEKERLHNINQKYLYEMTSFYPDEMDENGNLHYGFFDEYFVDPKRKAFFIYNGDTMVGFVMIHPYSVIGHTPDYTMAEFTICITSSSRCPIFSLRRRLSNVRTCSRRITESLESPAFSAYMSI